MHRRTFSHAVLAGTLAACTPRIRRAPPRAGIRAVAFDLFTIFDPRSIDRACAEELPAVGAELARLWKLRTFEYCWIRAAADRYVPFDQLVGDGLAHACRVLAVAPSERQRARLIASWTALAPWDDAEATLVGLRDAGLVLAPLANFAPAMIERLLGSLRPLFARVISTHAARSYKPSPRAYQLGVDVLELPRGAIAFAAFGGWDAAGAAWFGYPTYWVNRLGVASESLAPAIATGPDLVSFAAWVQQPHG
jgi:2-haloacid dehalogenase